jgi:hypothetical protein
MARQRDFRKSPRCGLDIATGEGERSSRWGGASLPLDLDEYCDTCRLDFFTCEANRPGEHAIVPEHEDEPLSHVESMRTWIADSTGCS